MSVRDEYIGSMSRAEALWEDGMYGHEALMQDDTHCFDCENLLDECECDGDVWMIANFGEDGLH